MLSIIKESYLLFTSPLGTSKFLDNFVTQPHPIRNKKRLVITTLLSNGPDKKESNNGFEYFGVRKGANFTIACLILLIGLKENAFYFTRIIT